MSKEKRLGRGLEALLGQISGRNESALPAQYNRGPNPLDAPTEQGKEEPIGIAPHPRPAPPPDFFEYPGGNSSPAINAPPEQPAGQAFGQPVQAAATLAQTDPPRVRIDQIDGNPNQPRQDFDGNEIQKLSESISAHGLLQPVVVRRVNDRYQIIAGERRLRAAVQAGWSEVPVNIVEADDRQTAELAIVENLQRKDLNALEKAACFQRYLEQYGSTQEELASRLNLDRSTIANLIRLLELPGAVQDALRRGELTPGHARALLPLGDEREQIEFCRADQTRGAERAPDRDAGAADDRRRRSGALGRGRSRRTFVENRPGPKRTSGRAGAGIPHRTGA